MDHNGAWQFKPSGEETLPSYLPEDIYKLDDNTIITINVAVRVRDVYVSRKK